MDYLQIYKEAYNRTFEEIKSQTIDEFKVAEVNHGNFNTFFTKITDKIYQEEIQIIEKLNKSKFRTCFKLFENRNLLFDNKLKEDEVISLVINNKIKKEFKKLGFTNNDQFIKEIAELQSIYQIQNHFRNYTKYYELIYEQGKYEYFDSKNFENNDYQSSKEYIEMYISEHGEKPNKIKPIILDEIKENNEQKITTTQRIKNEFDTKERAILIQLFKNRIDPKEIDTTVLIKLILIIGATDEFKIFDVDNASNSYLYKQTSKGYSAFKHLEQKDKIANLKVKLQNNGLKYIADELQMDYSQYSHKKKG